MKRLFAAVACLGLAAPAIAADEKKASTPTAAELSRLVMPQENWDRTSQALAAQVRQLAEAAAEEQGTKVPPGLSTDIATELISYQEVLDLASNVYAKHYSEAELRDLLVFYRSPVGQKTIRLQPEIIRDVNGQMMGIVQGRMPALVEKLKARVSKQTERPREQKESAPKKKAGTP